MSFESRLLRTSILTAEILTLLLLVQNAVAKSSDEAGTLPPHSKGNACSFDPDCEGATPYCNIDYDGIKNQGICESFDEPSPLQVIEGEDCPTGTTRKPIFINEGSEAVCAPTDD